MGIASRFMKSLTQASPQSAIKFLLKELFLEKIQPKKKMLFIHELHNQIQPKHQ